jgi:hypothetical protein
MLAGVAAVGLAEHIEHVGQERRRDAGSGIGDDGRQHSQVLLQRDTHPAALGCELHGVR